MNFSQKGVDIPMAHRYNKMRDTPGKAALGRCFVGKQQ